MSNKKNIFWVVVLFFMMTVPFHSFSSETAPLKEAQKGFTAIGKKAIPAVVSIKVKATERKQIRAPSQDPLDLFRDDFWRRFFGLPKDSQREGPTVIGQGSGFIISSDGYVMTNSHVVQNADSIDVTLSDGSEYEATVVGQDPKTDIAVLKIDGKNLPHLTLGNSDRLEIGEWVIAIGNPLGLQGSLTVGVVSAKGRSNLNISGSSGFEDFIQTDAAINRGNSGGPLLNLDGEVIGINTAIVSHTGGYMGIGFAIPSNMARSIRDQLIETGKVVRGFLGITLQQIDKDLAIAFDLDKAEGALIAEVMPGSPSEKSGLKQGDIILKFNDTKVENIAQFRNAISLIKPGTELALTILRNGKKKNLSVTIGDHPDNIDGTGQAENILGITVQALTPEVAQQLGYKDERAVVITDVQERSPAAYSGLRRGQLILSVNREPVSTPEEFYEKLQEAKQTKRVLLLVKQGKITRFVSLKLQ